MAILDVDELLDKEPVVQAGSPGCIIEVLLELLGGRGARVPHASSIDDVRRRFLIGTLLDRLARSGHGVLGHRLCAEVHVRYAVKL